MIDIIIIAVFSFWFAELTKIPQRLEQRILNSFKKDISLKPFSCTKCLAFWIGMCYGFGLGQEWYCIIYGGLCSFTGILLYKLFNKL